jgi:hypothetical protein
MCEHVVIRNSQFFCTNCGGSASPPMQVPVDDFVAASNMFISRHKSCPKEWVEPIPDPALSVNERAMFWMAQGEKGKSSLTIWNCLMGNSNFEISHPFDPDDFRRCYKLLEQVPEWNSRLDQLKELSPQWNRLVKNWNKLTKMLEKKDHRMYHFLQSCIAKP